MAAPAEGDGARGGGGGGLAPQDEPAARSEAEAGAKAGPALIGAPGVGAESVAVVSGAGREEDEGRGEPVRSAAAALTASSFGGGGLPDGG